MGFLLKPRITEREAAGIFLKLLSDNVQRSWPRILELIRPTFPNQVAVVDNEQAARMEFFLAVLASHLEELERVLHTAQAHRVREDIVELLQEPPFSDARDPAVREYQEVILSEYRRTWEQTAAGKEQPLEAIADLLYERLGATFSPTGEEAGAAGEGPGALASLLANFDIRWWRYFTHKYKIKKGTPRRERDGAAASEVPSRLGGER